MTRLRVALGVADSVRMISDQLRAPLPVQIELNAMLDRRAELAAVASDAERRGRFNPAQYPATAPPAEARTLRVDRSTAGRR